MALARLSAKPAEDLRPAQFPAASEFDVLLLLSIKDLSSACQVSKIWQLSASHIHFWKTALSYEKNNKADEEKNEEKKDRVDNRLLGYLIQQIASQNIQSVHRLIAMGAPVDKHYQGRITLASLNRVITRDEQRTSFLENPTPLVIAAIVSSERQGADIIHLLLCHGADILDESTMLRKHEKDEEFCDRNLPSQFTRDSKIKAFLRLTELEKRAEKRAQPSHFIDGRRIPRHHAYPLNSRETCCLLVCGLFIISPIITFFIIAPLITLVTVCSLGVLFFLSEIIVPMAKEAMKNHSDRRNFLDFGKIIL